ncbi:MAG: M48 family metalloprotease [Clostridiales bacterium]|nr:M48 family metalloprotease [Clostridiales bacterium]
MAKYISTYDQINNSKRNSIFVVIAYILLFALLFAFLGYLFGGTSSSYAEDIIISVLFGGAIGIIVSLIISIYTYRNSGKLLAKAANARELRREEEPFLYETINAIAAGAGINPPKPFIIETNELNAFASGSGGGKSMVAVTRGLINNLNREELEGVIAHEIAHLKNEDIKFVSLAAALSATLLMIISMISRGFMYSGMSRSRRSQRGGGNPIANVVILVIALVAMILAPLIVRIMQSAVSQQREYLADSSGAAIIGYPLGLASALEKIERLNKEYLANHESAFTNKSVHALCISRPMVKKFSRLFSTHPPIEERVKRLRGGVK